MAAVDHKNRQLKLMRCQCEKKTWVRCISSKYNINFEWLLREKYQLAWVIQLQLRQWGTSQCKLGQILNSYITPMFREHFAEYPWSCVVWSAATRKLFGSLVSTIIKTNHWRRTVKNWTCLVGPPWNHCEHIWGIIGAPVKMKSENKGLVDYVDLLARITFFFHQGVGLKFGSFIIA